MKKAINAMQWLGLLAVMAVVVWLVVRPSPPVDYQPELWSNWDGFMVISYAGVTREDSVVYPSSQTLIEQFGALKAAGYHTITPADALAFLERRAPLPDKALLILFEGARKETLIRAHPVLGRFGMQATLCVPTESLESWDNSRLHNRDMGKITRMPQWNLASMGHEAVTPIVVSETEAKDHFLSARKWLVRDKRAETDEEFRLRIEEDYRSARDTLAKLNGSPLLAYVYPFADDGRRAGSDSLAARINYNCVTSCFSMAFVSALNPFNPPGRNPYDLSRLRVSGDWNAAQLLTHLKRAYPLTAPVAGFDGADRWRLLNGARVVQDSLKLPSESSAWLKGSELWTDVEINTEVTFSQGAGVMCYARFQGQDECVRLSIGPQGVRLQESRAGVPVTMASAPAPTGQTVRVDWRLKGVRSWVALDGVPVFGPVPLAEPHSSGTVGFTSYQGRLALSALSVSSLRRRGVLAESWAAIPPALRPTVTTYLPRFPAPGEALSAGQGADYIKAVSEGASVWPRLTSVDGAVLSEAQIEALDAMLARNDLKPFVRGFALEPAQAGCAEQLRKRGYGVMHRVQAGQALPLAATNRVDSVWLEMTGTNAMNAAREVLHRHPTSQLMAQDPDVIERYAGVGQIMGGTEKARP